MRLAVMGAGWPSGDATKSDRITLAVPLVVGAFAAFTFVGDVIGGRLVAATSSACLALVSLAIHRFVRDAGERPRQAGASDGKTTMLVLLASLALGAASILAL